MENNIKITISKITSLILLALCPLLPIGYYIHIFNEVLNGGGTNDAKGWTLLFVIVIGIGILPVVGGFAVPFIVFLVTYKMEKGLAILITFFSISNVIFAVDLFSIYKIEGSKAESCPFYFLIWLIYAIISVTCAILLTQARKP